jgi:hypothetical protein
MSTQEKPEVKSNNVIPIKKGIVIEQESKEPTAREILQGALDRDLMDCVVIGRTKDEFLYFATSVNDFEFIWFCEKAKQVVLEGDE